NHPRALRRDQKTPSPKQSSSARCAGTRSKTSNTEKHGALRHTAGCVAPETEPSGRAENANLK
ncbi:hypothetical protein A2U01_0066036, partial [Trifolium medium]|nr:hypothetical protein [Trifolium medium]